MSASEAGRLPVAARPQSSPGSAGSQSRIRERLSQLIARLGLRTLALLYLG